MSRIGEKSDEIKILSETAGGYIVDQRRPEPEG